MARQTAANNKLVAAVKRDMNIKIFRAFSGIINLPVIDGGGEENAIKWLQQFFNKPITREGIIDPEVYRAVPGAEVSQTSLKPIVLDDEPTAEAPEDDEPHARLWKGVYVCSRFSAEFSNALQRLIIEHPEWKADQDGEWDIAED